MRLLSCVLVIAACKDSPPEAPPNPLAPVTLPFEVPTISIGFTPFELDSHAAILVPPHAIVIEGTQVIAVREGAVDASDIEGGSHGLKLPRVVSYLTALRNAKTAEPRLQAFSAGAAPLALVLEKHLPYRLLLMIAHSAKEAGVKRLAIVGRSGARYSALSITLPDRRPAAAVATLEPGMDLAKQLDDVRAGTVGTTAGRARIHTASKSVTPGDTSLDAELIERKITTVYAAGMKRCSVRHTKQPRAQAIEIELVVNTAGRAVRPRVSGGGEGVAPCIQEQVAGWRFPIPKDANGEPVEITAKLGFELVVEESSTGSKGPAVEAPSSPQAKTVGAPDSHPEDQPLGMIVSITKTSVIVWSVSGLEGTLKAPRRVVAIGPTAVAEVNRELAEIVKRRWGGKVRRPETREIIVQADHATPMQTVAELLGAVRVTADGVELFPDVVLAGGFE